jgi:hypothetical protein
MVGFSSSLVNCTIVEMKLGAEKSFEKTDARNAVLFCYGLVSGHSTDEDCIRSSPFLARKEGKTGMAANLGGGP